MRKPVYMRVLEPDRAVWIVAVLALGLFFASINNEITTSPDSATYILLAQAMASGKGYVSIYYTGDPPHSLYPFAFPLMLTPLVRLFGARLWLLKAYVALFAAGSIILAYRLLRDRMGRNGALLIAALLALNPQFGVSAHSILSEIPYTLFSLALLIMLGRYQASGRAMNGPALACLALFAVCFYTRVVALSFIPAACLFFVLAGLREKSRRSLSLKQAALLGAGMAVPVIVWFARLHAIRTEINEVYFRDMYSALAGAPGHYYPTVHGEPLLDGLAAAASRLAAVVFPYEHRLPLHSVGVLALLLLVLAGYARVLRGGLRIDEVYVAVYGAVVCYWPYHYVRLLVPILPFLLRYVVTTLSWVAAAAEPIHRRLAARRVFCCLVAGFAVTYGVSTLGWNVFKEHRKPYLRGRWADFRTANLWLKTHAAAGALVMGRSGPLIYQDSGLKTVPIKYGLRPEGLARSLDQYGPDYLLIEPFTEEPQARASYASLLARRPGRFTLVFRAGAAAIYRVRRGEAAVGPSPGPHRGDP